MGFCLTSGRSLLKIAKKMEKTTKQMLNVSIFAVAPMLRIGDLPRHNSRLPPLFCIWGIFWVKEFRGFYTYSTEEPKVQIVFKWQFDWRHPRKNHLKGGDFWHPNPPKLTFSYPRKYYAIVATNRNSVCRSRTLINQGGSTNMGLTISNLGQTFGLLEGVHHWFHLVGTF